MSSPTLTVVMPNYNHSRYLPKSLDALANRERPPEELIVIDDGSTDDSWSIIQDFAARYPFIRALKNDQNKGAEFTVSRALDLATGDYVCGAAADDFVKPGFVEKSMALLARYPQAGLCCTIADWQEVDSGLNWHMSVGMADEPTYLSPERMTELERSGRLFIAGHTVIVKRSALFEFGKFQSSVKYASDWFTYYLIGFRYGICYVPEPLAVCQILPNTYYRRGRRDKKGDLQVMENIVRLLSQPQFAGEVSLMRKAGSLYIWGYPMLKVLLSHREYRHFINLSYLRKAFWQITKLFLKRFTPATLGNLYFKLAGYRAKTPAAEGKTA